MDTIPIRGSEFYTKKEACINWHKNHPEPIMVKDSVTKALQEDEEKHIPKHLREPMSYPMAWRYTHCPYCGKSNWKD